MFACPIAGFAWHDSTHHDWRFYAGTTANLCLAGLVAAVRVTSLLSMDMLRNTFVTTVARFTQLHAPASMALKHAQAFRALLVIADENGNHLGVCHHHMSFKVSDVAFALG